ncbi:MAG: sensor histidine kinase, partial [Ornithinibacter sp.]
MGAVPPARAERGPVARVVRRLEAVPLRTRLVAIVGTLVGAALILTSLATAYLMRSDLMDGVDAELQSVARPVASQALADLSSRESAFPSNYAFELQSQFGDVTRRPTGVTSTPDLPELSVGDPRVTSGDPFTVESESGPLKWRFVAGRVTGANATFAVGIPLSTVNHTVTRLLVTTGFIGTLALLGSIILAWYAVRRAFRPLTRIEDTAAAIATGDLTQRIPVRQADDEVTSLSESLNVMLTRIESSFAVREASEERMRQFVADASHELRTPLATVRGYAELYRQGAVREPEAVAGAMERIEAESTRMSGLVEDLLTLARIDDAPVVEMSSVDLTVLAADAVADARVRAPERRIQLLGLDGPVGPTTVRGSEPRLRQVVTNLVANALRHTPEGTPVEVAVGHDADGVALEVRDHGAGVPEDVATKVFERFYRADPSRGRSG